MVTSVTNNNAANALNTSVQGAQKSAKEFAKAADNLQKGFAEEANKVSSTKEQSEAVVQSRENRLEASTALASQNVPDPVNSAVDMLKAENAYKANLEAFSAAAELEEEIINVLKRDV